MNTENEHTEESTSSKKREKIRIRYKKRVKLEKRPKGYKLRNYWKKKKKNLLASIILIILISITAILVVQVAKKQLEINQQHNRLKRVI